MKKGDLVTLVADPTYMGEVRAVWGEMVEVVWEDGVVGCIRRWNVSLAK